MKRQKGQFNKALTSEIKFCISLGEELRSTEAPPRAQKQPSWERAKIVTSRFVIKLLWKTVAKQNHTSIQIIGIKLAASAVYRFTGCATNVCGVTDCGDDCCRDKCGSCTVCLLQQKTYSGNKGHSFTTVEKYFTTSDHWHVDLSFLNILFIISSFFWRWSSGWPSCQEIHVLKRKYISISLLLCILLTFYPD